MQSRLSCDAIVWNVDRDPNFNPENAVRWLHLVRRNGLICFLSPKTNVNILSSLPRPTIFAGNAPGGLCWISLGEASPGCLRMLGRALHKHRQQQQATTG
jgi:hypothetical protein